jgi:hypothetical protein
MVGQAAILTFVVLLIVVDLRLHRLDKLLKFSGLGFKVDCSTNGDLVRLRELKHGLELVGEGFEAMVDDIPWDGISTSLPDSVRRGSRVRSWLDRQRSSCSAAASPGSSSFKYRGRW